MTVKGSTATVTIVRERLRRDRSAALAFAALCAAAAFVQRFDDVAAHLAGALIFGMLAACAAALLIHSQRHRELTLLETAAPIYGRELARAHAVTVCIIASVALCSYWLVSAAYGQFDPRAILVSALCAYAAALLVLAARVAGVASRAGAAIALAVLAACAFLGFAQWPATAAICAAVAFLALRNYGEVLARA